jgi:hypothetical protein
MKTVCVAASIPSFNLFSFEFEKGVGCAVESERTKHKLIAPIPLYYTYTCVSFPLAASRPVLF